MHCMVVGTLACQVLGCQPPVQGSGGPPYPPGLWTTRTGGLPWWCTCRLATAGVCPATGGPNPLCPGLKRNIYVQVAAFPRKFRHAACTRPAVKMRLWGFTRAVDCFETRRPPQSSEMGPGASSVHITLLSLQGWAKPRNPCQKPNKTHGVPALLSFCMPVGSPPQHDHRQPRSHDTYTEAQHVKLWANTGCVQC
jgi:hypothetical protein